MLKEEEDNTCQSRHTHPVPCISPFQPPPPPFLLYITQSLTSFFTKILVLAKDEDKQEASKDEEKSLQENGKDDEKLQEKSNEETEKIPDEENTEQTNTSDVVN